MMDGSDAEMLTLDCGDHYEYPTLGETKETFYEYADLILFLEDWDKGIVNITYQDYFNLPATLLDFRRLHKSLKGAEKWHTKSNT